MLRVFHGMFEIGGGGGGGFINKKMHFVLHFYMQKNAFSVTFLSTRIQTLCVTFLYAKNSSLCVTLYVYIIYPIVYTDT